MTSFPRLLYPVLLPDLLHSGATGKVGHNSISPVNDAAPPNACLT